tara:strand:+ start:2640 stop:3245 length:606 start_codon:yes stop_codon:yes gene_type:complete
MAEVPVDINRLAGVLNRSKALLDSVETQMGPSGDGGTYSQKSISENRSAPLPSGMVDSSKMLSSLPQGQTPQINSDPTKPIGRSLRNSKTTKMPKAVVEAMINSVGSDPAALMVDLDPELVNMINPNGAKKKTQIIEEDFPQHTPPHQESSFNRKEIKSLIKEVVGELIVEREVDEQVQIRVGDTIFTGKITKSKSINKKA